MPGLQRSLQGAKAQWLQRQQLDVAQGLRKVVGRSQRRLRMIIGNILPLKDTVVMANVLHIGNRFQSSGEAVPGCLIVLGVL